MDIIKSLNLNNTPKDIKNGSIVCAKNMMIDDTGSYLTQDISIEEAAEFDGGIVGVITCPSEIVVLTGNNKIYRLKDNDTSPVEVSSNWQYSGGKITGGYTYNYKNELVLVIAESGVEGKDIPLKSFIIHEDNLGANYAQPNQTYAIEENIPLYNSWYNIDSNGNLVCGVYTFFIRFKVDTDNYTKWFQITGDIIIAQEVLDSAYSHKYTKAERLQPAIWKEAFKVNGNGVSTKSIIVHVDIAAIIGNTTVKYDNFQLGYIIKRDGDIQGRIQGEYLIDYDDHNIISVIDNNWLETIGVDELIEHVHPMYNIETTCVYNNRLYIANYNESAIVDYSDYAKQIVINGDTIQGALGNTATFDDYRQVNIDLHITESWKELHRSNLYKRDYYINLYEMLLSDDNIFHNNSKPKILSALKNKLHVKFQVTGFTNVVDNIYFNGDVYDNKGLLVEDINLNLYWFLINPLDRTKYICVANHICKDANGNPMFNPSANGLYLNLEESSFDIGYDVNLFFKDTTTNDVYYLGGDNSAISLLVGYTYDSNFGESTVWIGNKIEPVTGAGNIIQTRVNAAWNDEDLTSDFEVVSYTPTGEDDDDTGIISPSTNDSNPSIIDANRRSLVPYQNYNFFVHYVRKDGSITPGYSLGTTAKYANSGGTIVPEFTNISYPKPERDDEFVAYFISYENVERNVDWAYVTAVLTDRFNVTNAPHLYNVENYRLRGNVIKINDKKYAISDLLIRHIENRLIENHVEILYSTNLTERAKICFLKTVINQYQKHSKILYRLTKNNYTFDTNEIISDKDYLPDYLQRQIIISYTGAEGIIADPANSSVFGLDLEDNGTAADYKSNTITYDVNIDFPIIYSPYPTDAMSVKEPFIKMATTLSYQADDDSEETPNKNIVWVNNVMPPDRLHDYLELKPAYIAKPSKAYTNYNKNNISRFDKTIYRSDVISDESLVNGFRHFDTNNYKNILENKGKITNIVGIGFYLVIHTEYAMFVFDRSPKLTSQATLNIPDTFDIEYQEVMPSNEGFGGLRKKEESILTKYGYIWYDYNNKYIFQYNEGKYNVISKDINNFLKHLNIQEVRFAEDIIHSRLIICIYLPNNDEITEEPHDAHKYITLSYNFNTGTYISFHDYAFSHNFRTYKTSYLILEDGSRTKKLYKYIDHHKANYTGLFKVNNVLAPTYKINGANYHSKSYVDIIYNAAFESSKSLESISYILNKIESEMGEINIADVLTRTSEDISTNARYSGDEMLIYTDETQSSILDIKVPTPINKYDDYKYPVFNKGAWQLNYFRNTVNPRIKSDDASLIYGKYIVVRFIFDNDDRQQTRKPQIKLESINFNVNPY